MTEDSQRNFRSVYYEKVGFRGVEEKKSLEILLKDDRLGEFYKLNCLLVLSHPRCSEINVTFKDVQRCLLPAVFSDRMTAEWFILGEVMDFSSLYFTETESDIFERPLKKSMIFFLI